MAKRGRVPLVSKRQRERVKMDIVNRLGVHLESVGKSWLVFDEWHRGWDSGFRAAICLIRGANGET